MIEKKNVSIQLADNVSQVDYWVNVFERMLTILFIDLTEEELEIIDADLNEAYFNWNNTEDKSIYQQCLEEYMINSINPKYKNNIVAIIYDNEEEE